MENDSFEQFDKSFENLTRPLADFVGCATKLPESANYFFDYYGNYRYISIESKIKYYLTKPYYIRILERWIDLLNNISDEIIEKSYPDENWGEGTIIPREEDRKSAKEQIKDAIDFITDILQTRKKLTPKPKYYLKCKANTKLDKLKETLVEYELIDDTSDFYLIMKGNKKDGYINWKTHPTYFRYFIAELFNTNLFEQKNKLWEIAKNSFTINHSPVPKHIRTYTDEIKDVTVKKNIDEAISILKKRNLSLQ